MTNQKVGDKLQSKVKVPTMDPNVFIEPARTVEVIGINEENDYYVQIVSTTQDNKTMIVEKDILENIDFFIPVIIDGIEAHVQGYSVSAKPIEKCEVFAHGKKIGDITHIEVDKDNVELKKDIIAMGLEENGVHTGRFEDVNYTVPMVQTNLLEQSKKELLWCFGIAFFGYDQLAKLLRWTNKLLRQIINKRNRFTERIAVNESIRIFQDMMKAGNLEGLKQLQIINVEKITEDSLMIVFGEYKDGKVDQ